MSARKMVVLGDFWCNWLDLSCMGVGYGPPKANTTNTGDLWAFFGVVPSTWAFGTGVPKAASRRFLVGEVAKRRGATEAPGDFFTHFEWPGPVSGTHTGRAWP